MRGRRRIAVLVSTVGETERRTLRGIAAYAWGRDDWHCQYQQASEENWERLAEYQPHGIIGTLWDLGRGEALQQLRGHTPIVAVGHLPTGWELPTVSVDNLAVGRLAAEHLLGMGHQRFAFVGMAGESYSTQRRMGFVQRLSEAGHVPLSHEVKLARGRSTWRDQDDQLRRFLRHLPAPGAIFASNDGRAVQLLEVARQLEIDVPAQQAVLGVDDDPLLCELSRPQLSSIRVPGERLGQEAAGLLQQLLEGRASPTTDVRLPPLDVALRQSTDTIAAADPEVATAVRYIRDHVSEPFGIDQVCAHVAVSRRSLERRFRETLGHTILQEVNLRRVEAAKRALMETDASMPEVARVAGFGCARILPIAFKRVTGQTPSEFRAAARQRG